MSRIGRQPIAIPDGVTVEIKPGLVSVKGPKGELTQTVSAEMKITQGEASAPEGTDGGESGAAPLTVQRPTDRGEHRALHGLTRSLIANMVQGVTDGFEKRLEIQGVGYRARLQGKALELSVGYSHPVAVSAPEGIELEVPTPTQVVVRGIDKQLVGEIAAQVRGVRPPEPYKGKGVKYQGEVIRRKAGKAGKK